jgi:hypothetical protein
MLVSQLADTVNTAVTFAPLPPRDIDARTLAHANGGKAVHAVDAADVADGLARVSNIPFWALSLIFRISVSSIVNARRLDQIERRKVRCGMRPLVLPRPKPALVPVVIEPVIEPVTDSAKSRFLHCVDEIGGVDAALNLLAGAGVELAA